MVNKLLFIEANTSGTGMLALSKTAELGFYPILLTRDPRYYAELEGIDCSVEVCDTNHPDLLGQTIMERFSQAEIGGIMTTSDFYLETAATLALRYGLPGNSPEALKNVRNKALTRQVLECAGIPQPRFATVHSVAEVAVVFKEFSLPCVVKPVDDSGSNNVLLCQSREQVEEHVTKILATLHNVRGQPATGVALIEEYLEAPEFSVEMFAWHGEMTCLGITQKTLTGLPYFVESRHIFPAPLSREQSRLIMTTVQQALTFLGISHGATHTEVKLSASGCFLIEVNARPAGGMIPTLIHLVTGIDLLEQQINSAVGRHISLHKEYQGVAGIQFLVADKQGILRRIDGLDDVATMVDIIAARATAKPGSAVQPPQNAYHRLGYIIAQNMTADIVVERLKGALSQIHISIE